MKIAINGWMRFGSCVAAGMLAFSAVSALGDAGNCLVTGASGDVASGSGFPTTLANITL